MYVVKVCNSELRYTQRGICTPQLREVARLRTGQRTHARCFDGQWHDGALAGHGATLPISSSISHALLIHHLQSCASYVWLSASWWARLSTNFCTKWKAILLQCSWARRASAEPKVARSEVSEAYSLSFRTATVRGSISPSV
jgi:hypothetical protein